MEIDQLPNDLQPHPNPLPNPHHRKVELQSPLDLTYLQENIAAAAKQKLDLHFPPDAASRPRTGEGDGKDQVQTRAEEEEDPMRGRVATLVNHFLNRTFDFASHSISINGNDVHTSSHDHSSAFPSTTTSSSINKTHPTTTASSSTTSNTQLQSHPEAEREGVHFSYEAYDPRLSTKLASLYAELERETLAVSQLRRTAPTEGARMVGEALLRSIKEDEERNHAEDLRDGQGAEGGLKLDPLPEGWREETGEMYERGLGVLRRLGGGARSIGAVDASLRSTGQGGSLTETVGKVQRARDVAMEFE